MLDPSSNSPIMRCISGAVSCQQVPQSPVEASEDSVPAGLRNRPRLDLVSRGMDKGERCQEGLAIPIAETLTRRCCGAVPPAGGRNELGSRNAAAV